MRSAATTNARHRARYVVLGVSVLLALTSIFPFTSVTASVVASGPRVTGDLLLFTRQICTSPDDPCWEIVVSKPDESHARVLAGPYPRDVWDDHFIANWAPDGRSVIFMADLGAGQSIWQVRTDGSHLHAIYTPHDGTGLDDGPTFTPDGKRIVFTRCCPDVSGYALWSISADGHNLKQVTSNVAPPGIDGPSDGGPQVSPDGRDVSYGHHVVDGTTEGLGFTIRIASLRTGIFTNITDTTLAPQLQNWSPDGRQLVFQSFSDVVGNDVWRVDRDGSNLTQLTFDGRSLNPSYTPDGRIIFSRLTDDYGRDLYVMHADGSNPTLVQATDNIERFPHMIHRATSSAGSKDVLLTAIESPAVKGGGPK